MCRVKELCFLDFHLVSTEEISYQKQNLERRVGEFKNDIRENIFVADIYQLLKKYFELLKVGS